MSRATQLAAKHRLHSCARLLVAKKTRRSLSGKYSRWPGATSGNALPVTSNDTPIYWSSMSASTMIPASSGVRTLGFQSRSSAALDGSPMRESTSVGLR
jgi:hypothetical protein